LTAYGNLGSSSFENRSLPLNDEINSSVQHADLVGELERHFHDDLITSQELDLWDWSCWAKRAREYVTGLIRQSV